jgi:protein involved in polysaccharide export with SLBB domain
LRLLLVMPAAAPTSSRRPVCAARRQFSTSTAHAVLLAVLLAVTPGTVFSQTPARPADSVAANSTNLGPGDFIQLKIWREPDLSDTVQVDNEGMAVFPKLGPIKVTGMRPDSLERRLVHDYSRYLQNPSINVRVLRRITIWGAVMRPGTYPVDLTMSITDALALAGGASAEGHTDKVELRRGTKHGMVDLSGRTPQMAELSLQSGDQLFVPQKSWISRNPGLIMAAIGTVTSIAYFVSRSH